MIDRKIFCKSGPRLFLPYWYRLTRVVEDKGPLNGCVCVCAVLIAVNCVARTLVACFPITMLNSLPYRVERDCVGGWSVDRSRGWSNSTRTRSTGWVVFPIDRRVDSTATSASWPTAVYDRLCSVLSSAFSAPLKLRPMAQYTNLFIIIVIIIFFNFLPRVV